MSKWECSECSATHHGLSRFCSTCGSPRNPALNRGPNDVAEGARFVPPWDRAGYKPSRPDDPCGEPGCDKSIRQHIAECQRLTARALTRAVRL